MKILFISSEDVNIRSGYYERLKQIEESDSGICFTEGEGAKERLTSEAIRKEAPDLLVNFNLFGFNQTTLTDNLSYNLLPSKQIHIITKDNLPNEKYLEKQLSISMFFYCTDAKYYNYLLEKYPDIPYLKLVEGWKEQNDEESAESNARVLADIVEEVMQICHMK